MIQIHALRHLYRGGPELRFDDWQVAQGDLALLRGPSGSGKSTLLALLAGLVDVQHGRVVVAGTDLAGLAGAARDRWRGRTLGFLPQRLALSDALTVRQNLQLAPLAAGLRHDPAMLAALAVALGLDGLLDRHPTTLSGGQAQRVALARALVNRPRVILADEPTASLDDAAAVATVDLLRDTAARESVTLVLATHDARVLARFRHHGDPVRVVDLPAPAVLAAHEVAT